MVWRDLGLNPGLPDHWRTVYPLGQCQSYCCGRTAVILFNQDLGGGQRVNTFPKNICSKVNARVRLGFELVYYDVAAQHISHNTRETPPLEVRKNLIWWQRCSIVKNAHDFFPFKQNLENFSVLNKKNNTFIDFKKFFKIYFKNIKNIKFVACWCIQAIITCCHLFKIRDNKPRIVVVIVDIFIQWETPFW